MAKNLETGKNGGILHYQNSETMTYNIQAKAFETELPKWTMMFKSLQLVANRCSGIEEDLKTIENLIHPVLYECGRGGSHIWISIKGGGKRIAMIAYEQTAHHAFAPSGRRVKVYIPSK